MLEAGLLWLPAAVDEQCSEVYFFLGTRALKVAVLRLEAGLGLLLALGVLLLLLVLPLLSLWFPPLTADLPGLSSKDFPQSITSDTVVSESPWPSLRSPSPSGVARVLIGSA